MADLDGGVGFTLLAVEVNSGLVVSGGGDLNGDGYADLLVANTQLDLVPEEETGAAFVVFGRDTSAPVEPTLTITGDCPGELTLTASGFYPNGTFMTFYSDREGTAPLENGWCDQTFLDLADPSVFFFTTVDENGQAVRNQEVGPAQCGLLLQASDRTTCLTSEVIPLPE